MTALGTRRRQQLAAARLYLCTDRRTARGDLADFCDAVLAAGVDVIQLREKGLEAREEIAALEVVAEAAGRHGRLFSVNDRADLALAVGADVLHVGQGDLPAGVARRLVGPDVVLGLSTHDPAQTAAAAGDADVDYFCVGPCWPTPTKPGRPAAGLELVRHAAGLAPDRPWFAIGGIDAARLPEVVAAGANRVVVVRAVTAAADPAAAVRQLLEALPPVPTGQAPPPAQ